jgi:hypothetical protein
MVGNEWKCPHCGNAVPIPAVSLEQDARVALLEHYTSQMQGYKVYLLTIVIGFFAGIESLRTLQLLPAPFVYVFPIFVGICLILIVYCLTKALWFGQHVRDITREDSDCKQTMLDQLDRMVHTKRGMVRDDPWSKSWMRWMIKRGGGDGRLLIVCVCILAVAVCVSLIVWG